MGGTCFCDECATRETEAAVKVLKKERREKTPPAASDSRPEKQRGERSASNLNKEAGAKGKSN